MDTLQNFGKNVSNTFTTSFTPFAARTQQFVKEQLGQADDKVSSASADISTKFQLLSQLYAPKFLLSQTQLPADYRELEARVDALQKVHAKILSVTSQYANEPYDYPPNLRESITDLSRNVTEKFQALSNAATPAEAQTALVSPSQIPHEPKTFAHAISRAASAASGLLPASDPLASGLEKLATASRQIGQARLQQDQTIVAQLVKPWTTNLNIGFKFSAKARQEVENARLLLDAAKAKQRQREHGGGTGPVNFFTKKDPVAEAAAEEQLKEEIEKLEDTFILAMEEAVRAMNDVLNTPEPLRGLSALITAQLEYHQAAADALQEVVDSVNVLQREQEASYRQSREAAS
ncbi:Endophilin-A2 [Dactylella cylindrospora]|nr:Endophilin-A2 [Dactylella cylindrospora]